MITNLTPEQESQLEVYRDKWIDIGLSTDRIDMSKMHEIIEELYSQANLEAPENVEVYESPFAAIKAMKEKYDMDVHVYDFTYGAHDAAWLSFFEYFKDVMEVEECERLSPLIEFSKNSGWALFYDELVVLTEKPIMIKFDENNQTHCEDDFAIKYSDNTGVAIWHSQQIPSEWIFDKKTITPEVVLHWENIEQRRCACEILGWAQVIEMLNAETIDKDADPTIGTLVSVNLPDIGEEKFLLAMDPNTSGLVGLPVPAEMKTALEANSWTYGIDKFDFKPDIRV